MLLFPVKLNEVLRWFVLDYTDKLVVASALESNCSDSRASILNDVLNCMWKLFTKRCSGSVK